MSQVQNQQIPYLQGMPYNPYSSSPIGQPTAPVPVYTPPTQPQASVGAVQIYINNPTVNGNGNTPSGCYPPNYYTMQPNQQNIQNNAQQAPAPQAPPPAPVPPAAPAQAPKAEEKKADAKPIVPLTDEYIMTLENYLNSPNNDVRLMASKEILKRFKEDSSRKDDPALTSLLNKALQDPSGGIRLIAMSTLDAGYAAGDDLTTQILEQMQNQSTSYNQDATMAANIMLKRAGQQNVADQQQAAQPTDQQQPGQGQPQAQQAPAAAPQAQSPVPQQPVQQQPTAQAPVQPAPNAGMQNQYAAAQYAAPQQPGQRLNYMAG